MRNVLRFVPELGGLSTSLFNNRLSSCWRVCSSSGSNDESSCHVFGSRKRASRLRMASMLRAVRRAATAYIVVETAARLTAATDIVLHFVPFIAKLYTTLIRPREQAKVLGLKDRVNGIIPRKLVSREWSHMSIASSWNDQFRHFKHNKHVVAKPNNNMHIESADAKVVLNLPVDWSLQADGKIINLLTTDQ
jgi:hypothetical protein